MRKLFGRVPPEYWYYAGMIVFILLSLFLALRAPAQSRHSDPLDTMSWEEESQLRDSLDSLAALGQLPEATADTADTTKKWYWIYGVGLGVVLIFVVLILLIQARQEHKKYWRLRR